MFAFSFVLRGLLLPVLCCLLPMAAQAETQVAPLVLERTIPLTGVTGRIDHMAVDLARKRLLVAELGNGTVDVIDLTTGKILRRIDGLQDPQGIGYAPKANLVAVASAGDGSVRLFRGDDFAPLGMLGLGDDADNIRLDQQSGQLVVGYGAGGLAVIDPANRSVVRRMALPAHPEGFQIDPLARRAFVNLPDAQQIAVVDLAASKQVATWRVPGLRANFPMARDAAGTILAIAFRNPSRLVLLDGRGGGIRASLPACGDADDVFFDQKRSRIYLSCGEGSVDVFQKNANSSYDPSGSVKTASGARTSLFVPELDRLFVAARAGFFGYGADAAILVLQPQP
jgi:hypothetical protein